MTYHKTSWHIMPSFLQTIIINPGGLKKRNTMADSKKKQMI